MEFSGIPIAGDRKPLRTLFDLAQEIRPRRGRIPPDDEALDELDWVVGRLFQVVEKLHTRRQTIGLITPLNVAWYTDPKKGRVLVLPDVGFVWQTAGLRPDWLADPTELEDKVRRGKVRIEPEEQWQLLFRKVWYPDPVKAHRDFDAARDLASVARLIDWVIAGDIRPTIPTPIEDPKTQNVAIYSILAGVGGRGVKTAAEFRTLVVRGKPRTGRPTPTEVGVAFLAPPKDKRVRRRGWLGWFLGLAALAAVGGGGVLYWSTLPPPPPPPPGHELYPAIKKGDRLYPLLEEFDQKLKEWKSDSQKMNNKKVAVEKSLPALIDVLERADKLVRSNPAEGDDREKELNCLRMMRKRVRDSAEETFTGLVVEASRKSPTIGAELVASALKVVKRVKTQTQPEEAPWEPEVVGDIEGAGEVFKKHLKP